MGNNQLFLFRIILLSICYQGYGAEDSSTVIYDNCGQAFASGNPKSREIQLRDISQDPPTSMRVFCQFMGDGIGYVFLSQRAMLDRERHNPVVLESFSTIRDRVSIQLFYENGTQVYTIIEQLDEYNQTDLTLLVNSFKGFSRVKNSDAMGNRYLYLGILDYETAANIRYEIQGFNSNGERISFLNCDRKPHNYFAFYPTLYTPFRGSKGSGLVSQWMKTVKRVPEDQQLLDPDFHHGNRSSDGYRYLLELHFGGCGAFETSDNWRNIAGTALGLPFKYDSCGDPGMVHGAKRIGDSFTLGSIIQYVCHEGYLPGKGSRKRICSPQKGWTGSPLHCNRVLCGEPDYGWPTQVNMTGVYYDDNITYACQSGYEYHSGDLTRKCQSNGLWSGRPLLCKRISCGTPIQIKHASTEGSQFFKDIVTYTCDTGYYTNDKATVTCSASGIWMGTPPKCKRIHCKLPPTVLKTHWEGRRLYGDVITYICDPGYYMVSPTVTLQCSQYGNWTGELPVCNRISCGPPPTPKNAKFEGTYLFGDSAMFFCAEGYILTGGDSVSECLANGKWSGQPILCEADPNPRNVLVFCPPVPKVKNATWSGPDDYLVPVGTLVRYICNEDNEFPDEDVKKTIACLSSGKWSLTPQDCRIKRCPPLPKLQHADTSTSVPAIRSVHDAVCHIGHAFPDGSRLRSIICLPNKKWSSSIQDCIRIPCPTHTLPKNLTPAPAPEVNMTLPEVPEVVPRYQCSNGTRSEDGLHTQVTSCGTMGRWTRPLTACEVDRCEAPPVVENATLVRHGVNLGQTAYFRCQRGSRFPSGLETHEIKCLGRDWDETVVQPCSVTNCPVPPDVLNATLFAADYFYSGTLIQYECDYGYWFSEGQYNMELECLVSGSWDKKISNCQLILCPDLEMSTGGIANTSLRTVDVITHVSCLDGKRFGRGHAQYDVTCLLNGVWSGDLDSCQDNRCPPVPIYPHTIADTLVVERGTVVTVTCLPGYELQDGSFNHTIECGPNLEWLGSTKICTEVYCGPAPSLPLSSTNQTGLFYGHEASISCDPGYEFSPGLNKIDFRCQEDASWSVSLNGIICQPLNCPPIPYVGNSTPSAIETLFNTSITYSCLHGYWIRINRSYNLTLRCAESGNWEPKAMDCLEIECPHVPEWLSIVASSTWRAFGAVVNYTCPVNMTLGTGEPWRLANCTELGEWSPPIMDCKEIPAPPPPPKEASGSKYIGTVSITIISILIAFVIILDLMTLQRDLMILRENLSYCFPGLAPKKKKKPPRRENLEMLPLMRNRSKLYTCENYISGEVVSFENPNLTSSNQGLLSISSGEIDLPQIHLHVNEQDPGLGSPVILKPLSFRDSSYIPYMEETSGDETYYTDSCAPSPKSVATWDVAASVSASARERPRSSLFYSEPLLANPTDLDGGLDEVLRPDNIQGSTTDLDIDVTCPLAHEEEWEDDDGVLLKRDESEIEKPASPQQVSDDVLYPSEPSDSQSVEPERADHQLDLPLDNPAYLNSVKLNQSDNALNMDSVLVTNGSLAHFSPSTEPLV